MAKKKNDPPPLSPAETEILRILWSLGKGTVQEVSAALPTGRQIAYATVQTLLRRLEGKGYVTHEERGKAHLFAPAVKPESVIKRTVNDFVERLFGGDPLPLMLHLADNADLTGEEIARLRRLLGKKARE